MTATRLTIGGLILLCAWLLIAPPAGTAAPLATRLLIGLVCALPLALLVIAGMRAVRQWGAWVAIVLIPYFALSVGAFLVAPERQAVDVAFATLIALVFFSGIAAARETR